MGGAREVVRVIHDRAWEAVLVADDLASFVRLCLVEAKASGEKATLDPFLPKFEFVACQPAPPAPTSAGTTTIPCPRSPLPSMPPRAYENGNGVYTHQVRAKDDAVAYTPRHRFIGDIHAVVLVADDGEPWARTVPFPVSRLWSEGVDWFVADDAGLAWSVTP